MTVCSDSHYHYVPQQQAVGHKRAFSSWRANSTLKRDKRIPKTEMNKNNLLDYDKYESWPVTLSHTVHCYTNLKKWAAVTVLSLALSHRLTSVQPCMWETRNIPLWWKKIHIYPQLVHTSVNLLLWESILKHDMFDLRSIDVRVSNHATQVQSTYISNLSSPCQELIVSALHRKNYCGRRGLLSTLWSDCETQVQAPPTFYFSSGPWLLVTARSSTRHVSPAALLCPQKRPNQAKVSMMLLNK